MARWCLTGVLAALAALHFYWALGGRWGFLAALPKTAAGELLFFPSPASCVVVGLALLAAAVLPVIVSPPGRRWLLYAMALVFALRAVGDFRYVGWGKQVTGTDFASLDTWLYSPLCVGIALLALAAAGVLRR